MKHKRNRLLGTWYLKQKKHHGINKSFNFTNFLFYPSLSFLILGFVFGAHRCESVSLCCTAIVVLFFIVSCHLCSHCFTSFTGFYTEDNPHLGKCIISIFRQRLFSVCKKTAVNDHSIKPESEATAANEHQPSYNFLAYRF